MSRVRGKCVRRVLFGDLQDKLLENYSPDLSLGVREFKAYLADHLCCDSSNIQVATASLVHCVCTTGAGLPQARLKTV